jgi:hypothetical protein
MTRDRYVGVILDGQERIIFLGLELPDLFNRIGRAERDAWQSEHAGTPEHGKAYALFSEQDLARARAARP